LVFIGNTFHVISPPPPPPPPPIAAIVRIKNALYLTNNFPVSPKLKAFVGNVMANKIMTGHGFRDSTLFYSPFVYA
jgi:hypothetical protein